MTETALPPITSERSDQSADIDALIEVAFGPGRYAKAAERLRETNTLMRELSSAAFDGGHAVGCARIWPIHIGSTAALLLGPFAVSHAWRGKGLGRALVLHASEAAKAAGHGLVLLVGDAAYFERCHFVPVAPGSIQMPGPVDMRRVLVRALDVGAADGLAGAVTPG
jgi:predicted N-acetyltransferase YhbS